ncbi:MAG: HTTM domain-containing protein [Anaerolineaceae bacterium]|nr:HTTM domain-containing protein [Anaerolineaceae bacterium]
MEINQDALKRTGNLTRIVSFITAKFQAYGNALIKPTDAASLAVFRLLFGGLMVWEVYRYHQYNRIYYYYIEPKFFFPYELFPFIAPLPGQGMYLVFFVMGLAALALAVGFFYRLAAVTFFLTYTYVFLIDKAQYNNHYYLISLISFLLIFVDGHRWASLDQLLRPDLRTEIIPFWHLFILRAQVFLVYFFGGVAKLNSDWLAAEPIRTWLHNRAYYPVAGPFFDSEIGAYFFAYGGLMFDLSIGTLLLWKRTRLLAFMGVLFFNLTNKWLFSIGIFPYVMIASTILFVEADWPRRWLRRGWVEIPETPPRNFAASKAWVVGFVTVYVALQILIPLRHWLYGGNVSWNEEGHRFSWHMKLRGKSADIRIYVTDPITKTTWEFDPRQNLTDRQFDKMASRPDMIIYYVHRLKEVLEANDIPNPIIQVEAWASLNGRPYQLLVDPDYDLAQAPETILAPYDWIIPLQTDLYADGKFVPVEDIED